MKSPWQLDPSVKWGKKTAAEAEPHFRRAGWEKLLGGVGERQSCACMGASPSHGITESQNALGWEI